MKIIHSIFVMSLATSSLTTQAAGGQGQGQGMGGHGSCQTTSEQVLIVHFLTKKPAL